MKNPALAYRQFSVQGATPLGLVVMLYDGAIAALQRAATAIETNSIQVKSTQVNKAQAIVAQLEGTLNFEAGGKVAQTLKALYVHARGQMLKADIENSAETLRKLARSFATVREAWHQADQSVTAPAAASSDQSPVREVQPVAQTGPRPCPRVNPAKKSPYAASLDTESRSWNLTG